MALLFQEMTAFIGVSKLLVCSVLRKFLCFQMNYAYTILHVVHSIYSNGFLFITKIWSAIIFLSLLAPII